MWENSIVYFLHMYHFFLSDIIGTPIDMFPGTAILFSSPCKHEGATKQYF